MSFCHKKKGMDRWTSQHPEPFWFKGHFGSRAILDQAILFKPLLLACRGRFVCCLFCFVFLRPFVSAASARCPTIGQVPGTEWVQILRGLRPPSVKWPRRVSSNSVSLANQEQRLAEAEEWCFPPSDPLAFEEAELSKAEHRLVALEQEAKTVLVSTPSSVDPSRVPPDVEAQSKKMQESSSRSSQH